jgi:hypothetical protein
MIDNPLSGTDLPSAVSHRTEIFREISGINGDGTGSRAEAVCCAGLLAEIGVVFLEAHQSLRIITGSAQSRNFPLNYDTLPRRRGEIP